MTLRTRLRRLEAKAPHGAPAFHSVILICDGETGEPCGAIWAGGGCAREDHETAKSFEARADAMATQPLSRA